MDRSTPQSGPVGLGRRRLVGRGDHIVVTGQVVESVYLVQEGQVALERPLPGREPVLLALVDRGGVFGDAPAFAGEPSLYRATARTRTTLLEIGRDRLGGFLSRDQRLFRWWLRSMACRVCGEERTVLRQLLGDLTAQVAGLLDDRAGDREDHVVAMSQREIARALGATRQSVSRVLQGLSEQGIVTTTYGGVEIRDRPRLVAAARLPVGPARCTSGSDPPSAPETPGAAPERPSGAWSSRER